MRRHRLLTRAEKLFRRVRNKWLYGPLSRIRRIREMATSSLAERGASILLDRGDHLIAVRPDDLFIGAAIIETGDYCRAELVAAIKVLDEAGLLHGRPLFLDIGANIGTQTLYALKTGLFTGALAVEPEPRNSSLLRTNLFLNGLSDVVRVEPIAAGRSAGSTALWLSGTNSGGHSMTRSAGRPTKENITVETLDSILARCSISPDTVGFVSIDVEGHEPDVIAGAAGLLAAGAPLLIELNPHMPTFVEMLATIRANYTRFMPLHGPLRLAPISEFVAPSGRMDVLFAP